MNALIIVRLWQSVHLKIDRQHITASDRSHIMGHLGAQNLQMLALSEAPYGNTYRFFYKCWPSPRPYGTGKNKGINLACAKRFYHQQNPF